jgi:hypothetical protein
MADAESLHKKHTGLTVTLAVLAALLLLVASIAFWFNSYVFNQGRFTQLTTSALQQESSRNALATELTDRLFANRPLLARVAEEPTIRIISGALGSSLADKVFTHAVNSLQAIATSPNPQDITLDLTTFKQVASRIAGVFDVPEGETAVQAQDVPDTVTLVSADKVPNIYNAGIILLWVGPLAAIAALLMILIVIYRQRHAWHNVAMVLAVQSAALFAAWLLALLFGPLFKPMVLAAVQSPNMQTVVGNVYTAFVDSFNRQVVWLFWLGLAFLVVALAIWFAKPVNTLVRKTTRNIKSTSP